MNKFVESNRELWDEYVDIHTNSTFYDLDGFTAGNCSLDKIELAGPGDVSGKSLLHLQCHFGLGTLSWVRLGAKATGVDFSGNAINFARSLAGELDLTANFYRSDIYELPDKLDEKFDVVFTSYGVLTWLPDIRRWGEVIGHFLKPGGVFYIVEFHPFASVFDDRDEATKLRVHYPYFNDEVMRFDDPVSYADDSVKIQAPASFEWMYRIGDVVSSLAAAGLRIDYLKEYPFTCEQSLPFMLQGDDGFWRLPDNFSDAIPLVFALRAIKE